MKARISQLYMTKADQLKWAKEILKPGELAVLAPDDEHPYMRLKVGDGERTLQDLDSFVDSAVASALDQIRFSDVIDGERITKNPNLKPN
jgi:hypothetical protein